MTNKTNKVLYTGVTNDLKRRTFEHKEKLVEGFTKRYNVVKLIFFEVFEDIENAIEQLDWEYENLSNNIVWYVKP